MYVYVSKKEHVVMRQSEGGEWESLKECTKREVNTTTDITISLNGHSQVDVIISLCFFNNTYRSHIIVLYNTVFSHPAIYNHGNFNSPLKCKTILINSFFGTNNYWVKWLNMNTSISSNIYKSRLSIILLITCRKLMLMFFQ